jgi:hypothetical protein
VSPLPKPGGTWGYGEFLSAVADPTHNEHANCLEWIGQPFDAIEFDLADVNARLQRSTDHEASPGQKQERVTPRACNSCVRLHRHAITYGAGDSWWRAIRIPPATADGAVQRDRAIFLRER